jgi:acyl carrier protein
MPARSLAEITEFIAKFVGVPAERLSASTTLFGDLGVDGQDGSDLLVAFGQRFSVDLSYVDLRRHFGNEWLWPWAPFYGRVPARGVRVVVPREVEKRAQLITAESLAG